MIAISPPRQLSISVKILSGKCFFINALILGKPMFDPMNDSTLSNISVIATAKTKDEKFLAYITTPNITIITTNKSTYIQ